MERDNYYNFQTYISFQDRTMLVVLVYAFQDFEMEGNGNWNIQL